MRKTVELFKLDNVQLSVCIVFVQHFHLLLYWGIAYTPGNSLIYMLGFNQRILKILNFDENRLKKLERQAT